jgi:hypothetical protein
MDALMNKNISISSLYYFAFFLLFALALNVKAQTQTYTYDALGRITFVNDSVNGNLDYDYDKAGNRLLVSNATATDQTAEPGGPPAPTGLTIAGPFSQSGGYTATWNASAGATYYLVLLSTGSSLNISGTSVNNQSRPNSVRACNSIACSSQVNF